MTKKYYLTPEGLEKLKSELETLTGERRQEIIERIQEAVAHGDLSENADYAQAKEEQAFVEARIQEIEEVLRYAEIIQSGNGDYIGLGSTIKIKVDGKEFTYTVVGSSEANPALGKISNESTVGQALMGHKKGDKVEVDTPAGKKNYEIVDVG